MTEALDAAENALINAIRQISDDVDRYQAIKNLEARLLPLFKQESAGIASRLHSDRSWSEVGKLLGVTGSRAEQISRGSR